MVMADGRRHPERPIVAVGAVILDGDRVLLVKRGQEPLKGEWSLPGGAVEIGETLQAALVREVREETCLDIEVGPVVDRHPDLLGAGDQGQRRGHLERPVLNGWRPSEAGPVRPRAVIAGLVPEARVNPLSRKLPSEVMTTR